MSAKRKLALGQGFFNTCQYRQVTYAHMLMCMAVCCFYPLGQRAAMWQTEFDVTYQTLSGVWSLSLISDNRLGTGKSLTFFYNVPSCRTNYTVIRFVSISAKFDVCIASWVLMGHLLKLKYAHSSVPSAYFSFNKCPIQTRRRSKCQIQQLLRRNGLQCKGRRGC